MADVCEVTGTSVDLMGDVWPDGSFQLQRFGDASFPGSNDVSVGQPQPLVTDANGVIGHVENGSFVAGFALVQNSNYYLTPFRSDTQAALPRIRLAVPDGTTAANIATLVITDPVPPLDQAAQAVADANAAADRAEAAADAVFVVRNQANAQLGANLPDGSVFYMAGLPYEVDSSVSLTNSATEDLGVAGVVAFPDGGRVSVSAYGMRQDGTTDDTAALRRALRSGLPLVSNGPIRITSTVTHNGDVDWLFLDGSRVIVDSGTYASGFALEFMGSVAQVEDLSGAASKGDYTFTAASNSSLTEGDIGMIFNPTNGSWSGFRDEYKAGEMFRVTAVAGATVTVANRLYDTYAASDVDVYEVTPIRVNLDGIKVDGVGHSTGLILVRYADTPVVTRPDLYNRNNSCLVFDKCLNYEVREPNVINLGDGGDDYGIVGQSSQHGRIWGGYGYGRRHPFTTAQDGQFGTIPCRDCLWIGGTLANNIDSEVPAADLHGASEFCGFENCHISGGFDLSGSNNWIKGGYCSSMKNGVLGFVNEALGGKYVVDGVHFESFNDPGVAASRGGITIGAQSDQITANTTRDLTLQVTNNQFVSSAWGAGVTIVFLANRGTSRKLNVDCRGNDFDVSDFGQAVRVRLISGTADSDFIICDDNKTALTGKFSILPDGDYSALSVLRCQSDVWSDSIITSAGLSKATANLHTFKWQFPRLPSIMTAINRTADFTSGSIADVAAVEDVAANRARLFIATADGSNYSSGTTLSVAGRAEIREV